MDHETSDYLSYLLRLWRADNAGEPLWRAALENPRTGERQVFSDLAGLFAYLQEKTGESHLPSQRTPSVD